MTLNKIIAVTVAAPLVFGAAAAFAEYPEKPIKLIIPYRAGGGSDSLARTMQAAIEKHKLLPVPLVITNITGAAGAVAARRVKDAKPDGYTILQIHNGIMAIAATGRLGFGLDVFAPVAQTTQSCIYLAVPSTQPWQTFEDLVKYAKANPGKLKAADSVGGITHFSWIQLMKVTGTKVGIVHYGGTSKRFASMKGGHTQAAFMSPGWIKRGADQLRGLLWLGPKRHAAAPNMPTAKEKGIDVVSCLNRRFWMPKGTPAARVGYFAGLLKKAMATDEMKAYHKKRLGSIVLRTGDDLKKDIAAEMQNFNNAAPVVKAAMGKK
ncbi:MAG: tripartite tricarboxylate transporter substrate binding protein [Rhodospirillales bacterium]|jgi:tripartite-type tricarboxylate transporter receptor subunit TctC|nr:tripartite tricarboxylate transporter substrate binding protein [Rhodospirillales bacterium]MDP6644483.1 tripartite tricarboxylate transporter substrate binding protein [Rhodospirillales bacterium]MDP6840210.1 tripartite tricarboxylate transporter substrate binding protein [Rhodospirillales bacterium]|tara:strand:+ start:356 stop:1318 length:963 start_codon:yes stop_codon:yes gene_type:complete